MTQPATGELTWRLQSQVGPLTLGKVRVTLQSMAHYPAPEATPASEDAPPPMPSFVPVEEPGAPLIVELTPEEVGLSSAWPASRQAALKLSLKSATALEMLAQNPLAARVALSIALLDDAGAPSPGDDGTPLTLTATNTVL
jgi:hypothetical protein